MFSSAECVAGVRFLLVERASVLEQSSSFPRFAVSVCSQFSLGLLLEFVGFHGAFLNYVGEVFDEMCVR
jgi:hypothetical protein